MSAQREPVYFGDPQRPLFGWLHRPEPAQSTGLGLVICNPFGYEAICTHRALRHFAVAAAKSGAHVLRFDYDGTGDSCGDDLDPNRLDAWIASVHRAIEALYGAAPVKQVCLLGLRLGGLVATLAAQGRPDVAGVAAIAPVLQGRSYVRELRAFAAAQQTAGAAPSQANELLEVGGFMLTADTQQKLAAIDLHALTQSPARRILVIQRSDLPSNDRWPAHLRSLGAEVDVATLPGYAAMMLDPHDSVVPEAMVSETVAWLARCSSELANAPARATPPETLHASIRLTSAQPEQHEVEEQAIFLDAQQHLFGIVAKPVAATTAKKAVVLLNAGSTHHIGPNRWYVHLARQWAAQGMTVLRMDISGVADSLPRPGADENVVYTEHARTDLRAAIAYLRSECDVVECYAVGLCSGAYHAFKSVVAGVDVDGLVMINPLTFFWKEGMSLDARFPAARVVADAARYQRNMWQLTSWLKLLRGEVGLMHAWQVIGLRMQAALASAWRNCARRLRLRISDDLGSELDLIAHRRVPMSFVFAADDPGLALLRMQGGSIVDKLLRRGQLRIQIVNGADHVFASIAARHELTALLTVLVAGNNSLTSL